MLSHTQNFINNTILVDKMMNFVNESNTPVVLEVGPGAGIITNSLLKKYDQVIAVEADKALFDRLKSKYFNYSRIDLHYGDFLKYTLPNQPFDLVSNIPFNITSDIVRKITENGSNLKNGFLVMQTEAAKKFAGIPYSTESSLLSHILKLDYTIDIVLDIPKQNFTPRPKYDAALLLIKKLDNPFFDESQKISFKDFITFAFSKSKPLLGDVLRLIFKKNQINLLQKSLKLNFNLSIKSLSFERWLQIFHAYSTYSAQSAKDKVRGSYNKLLSDQSKLQKTHRTRRY